MANLEKNPAFGQQPLPGSLNLDHPIRLIVNEAIQRSPKKREQIAEELSELLGIPVTVSMLNKYTSEAKALYRFPLAWLPAFCIVTSDLRAVELLAEKLGLRVIDERQWQLLEFGRAVLGKERADRDLERMRQSLVGGGE